jgi:MFS transporter, DHA1 family, multidrug resistance protein
MTLPFWAISSASLSARALFTRVFKILTLARASANRLQKGTNGLFSACSTLSAAAFIMPSDTPRSSMTINEPGRQPTSFVGHDLEEEIAREEKAFEAYGGDDPHEPAKHNSAHPTEDQKNQNVVTWDGPDDPTNPQNWTKSYKWFITVLCCVMTINVYVASCHVSHLVTNIFHRTFASSAPTSASTHIAKEFGISSEISYLITTLFLIGYVVGPIVWGPGSELYGRRPIFWIAMTSYTLFHLGQALLVTRFFGGMFAVAPLTNCGGMSLFESVAVLVC